MSAIAPPPVPEDVDEARAVERDNERALESLVHSEAVAHPRHRSRAAWLGSLAGIALLGAVLLRRRSARRR